MIIDHHDDIDGRCQVLVRQDISVTPEVPFKLGFQ